MKIEESLKELENIVAKLESGNLGIDESVNLYTKGVKFCMDCTKKLDEIKGKITLLESNAEGLSEKEVEVK